RSVASGWVRGASSATRTPGVTRSSAPRTPAPSTASGRSPSWPRRCPGPPATSSSPCTQGWARRRPSSSTWRAHSRTPARSPGCPRDALVDGSARAKPAGVVGHPPRPPAAEAARAIGAWLEERGVQTRTIAGDDAEDEEAARAFARDLDVVLSVGGDGTFLRAARVASVSGIPVLGVKVGRMGFLTEVEPDQAAAGLERMLDGTARIEERLAVVAEGSSFEPQWALNEVIVEKSARHRLIRLPVVGGETHVAAV